MTASLSSGLVTCATLAFFAELLRIHLDEGFPDGLTHLLTGTVVSDLKPLLRLAVQPDESGTGGGILSYVIHNGNNNQSLLVLGSTLHVSLESLINDGTESSVALVIVTVLASATNDVFIAGREVWRKRNTLAAAAVVVFVVVARRGLAEVVLISRCHVGNAIHHLCVLEKVVQLRFC